MTRVTGEIIDWISDGNLLTQSVSLWSPSTEDTMDGKSGSRESKQEATALSPKGKKGGLG